jgi:hypothetical protein
LIEEKKMKEESREAKSWCTSHEWEFGGWTVSAK